MARKKDYAVVSVISDLTAKQASQITKDIMDAKQKHAPNARGTAASGTMSRIGSLLQRGNKRIGG